MYQYVCVVQCFAWWGDMILNGFFCYYCYNYQLCKIWICRGICTVQNSAQKEKIVQYQINDVWFLKFHLLIEASFWNFPSTIVYFKTLYIKMVKKVSEKFLVCDTFKNKLTEATYLYLSYKNYSIFFYNLLLQSPQNVFMKV